MGNCDSCYQAPPPTPEVRLKTIITQVQKLEYEKGQIHKESYKFRQFLYQPYEFKKYQFKQTDTLGNIEKVLKSTVFGGDFSKVKNPLKEQISVFKVDDVNHGGFYYLHNVQKKLGDPTFFDIWILIDSIKDKELFIKIQSLDALSRLNISFWKKEMLYPYERKFLTMDEIAPALTGFARIVEFRAFKLDKDKVGDPTFSNANQQNWLLSISEGQIQNGRANGYSRHIDGLTGFLQMGYFKNGVPNGKYIHIKGLECTNLSSGIGIKFPYGIYQGNHLIKEEKKQIVDPQDASKKINSVELDFILNDEPSEVRDPTPEEIFETMYQKNKEFSIERNTYKQAVLRQKIIQTEEIKQTPEPAPFAPQATKK